MGAKRTLGDQPQRRMLSGTPEKLSWPDGSAPAVWGWLQSLLDRGGLLVVGSRDRSEEDGEFARRVGEHCAQENIAVISGAAKGIDRDAMSGALEAGGWALGVLAEGLAKTATSGQFRSSLVSERLTLVSPYDPDSRWFVYAAMGRNKLLYGLSDAALVVASSAETGGTWAGADEALQHGRVKVFVKSTGAVAPGNPKLLRLGGIPFPAHPGRIFGHFSLRRNRRTGNCFLRAAQQLPSNGRAHRRSGRSRQRHSCFRRKRRGRNGSAVPRYGQTGRRERRRPPQQSECCDAYSLVIEQMLALLNEPRTDKWLADKMCVRAPQIKDWLARGVREGRITKLKEAGPLRRPLSRPFHRVSHQKGGIVEASHCRALWSPWMQSANWTNDRT